MKRIAVVNKEKCKPSKCNNECIKRCPVQKTGKRVIEIVDIEDLGNQQTPQIGKITNKNKIAKIVESLCNGCNQCVKACPFNAITIVNLPKERKEDIIHRYRPNSFSLYRLPKLKKNCVSSIIGENGIGKTTVVDILSGKYLPNFEDFTKDPTHKEIFKRFAGTEILNYLKDLYSGNLIFSIKEQKIKKMIKGNEQKTVNEIIQENDINLTGKILESFDNFKLNKLLENKISTLSGGELQKLLCWITCTKPANVYIFDEPSNFLDIKQRMEVGKLIKELASVNTYVLVIEHDLSMLDYMADRVNVIYGQPSVFGIVSIDSMSLLNGLNEYMEGFIKCDNMRIRPEAFNLKIRNEISEGKDLKDSKLENSNFTYNSTIIEYPNFKLIIPQGNINLNGSINVILGENGVGKTTFMNYISSNDDMGISYKRQHINPIIFMNKDNIYPTVKELFYNNIKNQYINPVFKTDVLETLDMKSLEDRTIDELSGGELQKVSICFTLGTPANIYLLDEPSSNLDIENRLKCIKAIKRFSRNSNKCVFIIEHDITMAVALSQEENSKILLINSVNNTDNDINNEIKNCKISEPLSFNEGINAFLKEMNITMRISGCGRPRINKSGSQMDTEQKNKGTYYGI